MTQTKMFQRLTFAAVFLTCSSLFAQGGPKSLDDYISAALRNSPLIGAATNATSSARLSSEAVRKGYYPQILIGSHVLVAPGYDPAITNGGELGAQVSSSYVLFDGGSRSMEVERGGLGVEAGKLGEARTRADIIYSVSTAYVTAVKEKRELSVVEQNYNLLKDYLRLTEELHASGQGSETDVLKTTVELNNARIDINARTVSYANALIALAQAAGLRVNEASEVDTTIVEVKYDTTFDEARNVDIASQQLALQDAQLQAKLAGARMKPTVAVGADAGALTSLPNLEQGLANVFGASVGISVAVPVFTFGSLEDGYDAAQASAKSLMYQNEYSRIALQHQFEATRNEIVQADSEIVSLKENLQIAKQNLLLSKARYAGGSGLSLEVLDAIQTVNQIELSIEEARANRTVSELKLNRLNYPGAR